MMRICLLSVNVFARNEMIGTSEVLLWPDRYEQGCFDGHLMNNLAVLPA